MIDKKKNGRPPIYSQPMKQTAVWLPLPMIDWLRKRGRKFSVIIRELIQKEMDKESNEQE